MFVFYSSKENVSFAAKLVQQRNVCIQMHQTQVCHFCAPECMLLCLWSYTIFQDMTGTHHPTIVAGFWTVNLS